MWWKHRRRRTHQQLANVSPSDVTLYRFSRTRQGQAACGGGCVSGEPFIPPARNLSAIMVVYHFNFAGFSVFWGKHPRGPNFAEIHARGRRGRLELDHRDLIPPWGHGLLHGEAGKPTMAVWHDGNGGALPSQLTAMAGRDNRGMTAHNRILLGSRQPIRRPFRRRSAADVGTAAHNRCSPGTSRAEMCAWMPGSPGETGSRSDLIRAIPGEDR